jgi:hypothetical protein
LPQLIRHVQIIHRAMSDSGTRLYLKIGTTGTGGMGLNIPYTHSEDRPSFKLMSKTAVAFAHTGLMFLMARTPNGPLVKELKPGAMIGYRRVASIGQTARTAAMLPEPGAARAGYRAATRTATLDKMRRHTAKWLFARGNSRPSPTPTKWSSSPGEICRRCWRSAVTPATTPAGINGSIQSQLPRRRA